MREEVSFEIIVEKKYPEVKKAVEEYFNQEEWRVTEEDVRDKDKYPDSYGEKNVMLNGQKKSFMILR